MSSVTEKQGTAHHTSGLGFLLASTGVSVTGDGMLLAAAPLMAAALSRDPLAVASVTAAGYAAWLVLGLPSGALVDRWNRRAVMITADLGRAAVLAVFTVLVLTGHATIPLLTATVFLVGVGSCFFDPAAQALIPTLVGRDKARLAHANGRLWAFDTFGRALAGPPLGAGAFAAQRALPFGADALSFVVSAALVSRLPATPAPAAKSHPPIVTAIRGGVVHLFRHPELRAVTLGMTLYNLGYNVAFATLVLYAQDVLDVGTVGYGLLVASMAVGGIAGGWLGPRIAKVASGRTAYALTLGTQAIAWLLVLVVGNAFLAGIALACVGAASTTGSVVGGSIRQLRSPDELLGRVMATTRLLGIGSAAVGAVVGGIVADTWGLRAPFWVAGVLLLLASLAFAARRNQRD